MTHHFDEIEMQNKLQHIAAQLTNMHLKGVDVRDLGFTALEILIARNTIEEKVGKDYSKEHAEKLLGRIKELEKGIISLYMIGRVRGEKWVDMPFINFVMRGYGKYPYIEAMK